MAIVFVSVQETRAADLGSRAAHAVMIKLERFSLIMDSKLKISQGLDLSTLHPQP